MGKRPSVIIAVLLTSLSVAAATGGATGEDRKFSCEPDIVFGNESVRVMVQGLKGHIKVFDQDPGDAVEAIYTYTTGAIVEMEGDEVVATMDLSRALPMDSLCAVFERDDHIEFVYHVHTEVTGPEGGSLGHAGATFLYRLDDDAKGAKFDLLVRGWPWSSGDTELAFAFQVHSPFGVELAANGLGFHDRDGNPYGYIDWEDTATVEYEDEREEEARVEASLGKTENNVDVRLRYTGVDPAYVELDYDPWVGTGGYEIIDGTLYGEDWLDRQVPRPLRPFYQQVSGLVP